MPHRVFYLSLLTFLLSFSAFASPPAPRYASPGLRIVVESSVRVMVTCDGKPKKFGTGTAVDPTHVLTANHVAKASCEEGEEQGFIAIRWDLSLVPMRSADAMPGVDAALLEVIGSAKFDRYAHRAARGPAIGERVWLRGGHFASVGDADSSTLKAGYADGYSVWEGNVMLRVSTHVVAGNSGGGIFNEAGELVGIVNAGMWYPDDENYALCAPSSSWGPLLDGLRDGGSGSGTK